MIPLQFLLDERIPLRLQHALRRTKPSVVAIAVGDIGAPPLNTLDPDLLLWCENNDFTLLTNNRKSMPQHLKTHLTAGRRVPGIFVVNLAESLSRIVAELVHIAHASLEGERADRIQFLPIT